MHSLPDKKKRKIESSDMMANGSSNYPLRFQVALSAAIYETLIGFAINPEG